MQVFANGKRRFHSFIEFYAINLKNQEVKIWSYDSTLNKNREETNSKWSQIRQFLQESTFKEQRDVNVHLYTLYMLRKSKIYTSGPRLFKFLGGAMQPINHYPFNSYYETYGGIHWLVLSSG